MRREEIAYTVGGGLEVGPVRLFGVPIDACPRCLYRVIDHEVVERAVERAKRLLPGVPAA